MKSGFVAIIGRPNAGKSSLLNVLLNDKIAIVTDKAQTTRNAIRGIYNKQDLQIIFTDTPGVHNAKTSLGSYMNKEALSQAFGNDVIYYIVDSSVGLTSKDDEILNKIFSYEIPIFLLLNKTDICAKGKLAKTALYAKEKYRFDEIIPLSALNKENLDELIKTTISYFHDEIKYYQDDANTDISDEFRIAEIIREKIINNTHQEVPHLVAIKIDTLVYEENKVKIECTIICNKANHKAIIIGKNGEKLKKINTLSLLELKKYFHKKIFLSLFVRVEEDWFNSSSRLFDLGYFKGDKNE